jgi:hypothetical protein
MIIHGGVVLDVDELASDKQNRNVGIDDDPGMGRV